MATHDSQTTLSVVVPVYRGRDCLDELYRRLIESLTQITHNFEIILVDDGCPENSWEMIAKLSNADARVIGVKLSRNFGQHAAITAGLDRSKGEWVVVMDCDLQDQPEEINKLFEQAQQGWKIVLARRKNRSDSLCRQIASSLFYSILGYLTNVRQNSAIANFGIYHKNVIDVTRGMREQMRYFPIMVQWTGFESKKVDVVHGNRMHGKSSYSFIKLLHLAIDVILAFSDKPLRLVVNLGLFISALSFVFALFIFGRALLGIHGAIGWPSLIISIWFLSGVNIFIIGIIGLYIGKIFDETKKRPLYVIAEEK